MPTLLSESWQRAAAIAVATGVGVSVVLISVALGVRQDITNRLGLPVVRHTHVVNVSLISNILTASAVIVTLAVLLETAIATFVLGTTVMHSRRQEIAIRRQSGVLRSTLLLEFARTILSVALIGGVAGELMGIGVASVVQHTTVLPAQFNAVSLLSAFPVAVLLSVAATLIPAWKSANASPALLRRGA